MGLSVAKALQSLEGLQTLNATRPIRVKLRHKSAKASGLEGIAHLLHQM